MSQIGSPAPSQAPRGSIDFAVLSEAFEIVKNNAAAYVVFTLIGLVASYALSTIMTLPFTLAQASVPAPSTIEGIIAQLTANIPLQIASTIVQAIVYGLMYAGIAALTLKAIRGEPTEIGDAFTAFNMFGPIALAATIYGIATTLGWFCCIGYFIIAGLLIPLYPIILVEKLSVMDAIKRSINLMGGHILMASVFVLVQTLVGAAGVIACCVGILFTVPLAATCNTLIYRDLTGYTGHPASATVYPRDGGGEMPNYTPHDPSPPHND